MSDPLTVSRRPTRTASVVSLVVAAAVVAVIEPPTAVGVTAAVAGLLLAREGVHRVRSGARRLLGSLLLAVGTLVVGVGCVLAIGDASNVQSALQAGCGVFGVLLVGIGLLPLRGSGSRGFVKAGSAFLVLAVVSAGLFQDASTLELAVACVGSVLVWDAAETAINVGEQVGREPKTWPVEVGHLGGSSLAGGVAAVTVLSVEDLGTGGLELHTVALLLVVLVLLTLALHD